MSIQPNSNNSTTKKDWHFDLGRDARGFFVVKPFKSDIPDIRFSCLSRKSLQNLRDQINKALREYPEPEPK